MEMRCYCKILHISYKDHVTNEEVCAKIQQANGPHEDLLTIVKRCKLQWYGHVSCLSAPAKTILQGTVKGGRRQGRHRKRWEDNIRELTGLEFAKSQRAEEKREKMEKTGYRIICGAPKTLAVKGWTMMMMKKSLTLSVLLPTNTPTHRTVHGTIYSCMKTLTLKTLCLFCHMHIMILTYRADFHIKFEV